MMQKHKHPSKDRLCRLPLEYFSAKHVEYFPPSAACPLNKQGKWAYRCTYLHQGIKSGWHTHKTKQTKGEEVNK